MVVQPSITRRILMCTDFSANADYAFRFAVDAAVRRENARLYLLHVIPEPDAQFWRTYIYDSDFNVDEKAKHDLDEKVDRDYRPLVPPEVEFQVAFRIGRDSQKILEYADEIAADLIVIGRQGLNPLKKIFFGSVAEKIATRAKCPVIVVPKPVEQ